MVRNSGGQKDQEQTGRQPHDVRLRCHQAAEACVFPAGAALLPLRAWQEVVQATEMAQGGVGGGEREVGVCVCVCGGEREVGVCVCVC